ncbi:MAG: 2-C-methyl-D-erythritol 2,4-cyclodiphosphate synthase [Oscillospiraceae bacterium]|nr:2-C-methyl-D-erythritol 2,4-cyclodiphosphate synthase [Oscillospiraceae bacterium]
MQNKHPKACAIIAAAGKSSRMNLADGMSKQLLEINKTNGKTVIEQTVTVFNSCVYIDEIIIAARNEDIEKIREIVKKANLNKVINIIAGGETRRESVFNAVGKVRDYIDFIAIHDGARCFISHEDIEKVMLKAFETGAAAAGTKITDTIKLIGENNNIIRTVDRDLLWAVQTPQIFSIDLYLSGLNKCGDNITDDCAVVESMGHPVSIVECSKYNIKITDTQDLKFLEGQKNMRYKTGHGYDAHRLGKDRKLILGGVEIPNENVGLIGHSDADVLIHALIDAMLGAAGLGDIGEYFPDNDEKYKNISSLILLDEIAKIIKKDYIISNIDCTVILEKPKLAKYKKAIKEKLGEILGIDIKDINIKAKTEEGLGFTGTGEGIAAQAICLIQERNI